jgi:hypothetical protein
MMRRREVITLLGGAAAWPLAARAQQQPDVVRRISRGCSNRAGATAATSRWSIDGAAGDADRIRRYAAELVALAPDIILPAGTANVALLLKARTQEPSERWWSSFDRDEGQNARRSNPRTRAVHVTTRMIPFRPGVEVV